MQSYAGKRDENKRMCVCVSIDYVDMKTLDNSRSGHKRIKSMTLQKKKTKRRQWLTRWEFRQVTGCA